MNARADALMASVPPEQQVELVALAKGACTSRERTLFVAMFEGRAAKIDGGARYYRQTLERIDVCLALRRAQQAPFNAILAAVK